jgi:signal transduction histidine kinase/phage shock protein PspC (stress-responsive transcriptional regulator)
MGGAAAGRDHRPVVTAHRTTRLDIVRPEDGRMVAGVAAGLGDAFGIDANVVRSGFVVLAVASGLGVILYGAAWALMPPAPADTPRPAPRADLIATIAFGAVVLGCLLGVRAVGLWPGDVVVWPLAAALVGLALLAMRAPATPEETAELPAPLLRRLPPDAAAAVAVLVGTRRGALARLIAGSLCILIGLIAFVVSFDSWSALRSAIVAGSVVLAGIALVLGPAIARLAGAFTNERRERIRADERAEVAAHLHDSVLQTLALVQRRADDPREVKRLARMQERELRAWLLGGDTPAADPDTSLGAALEKVAAAVETEHGVPVEVVRVRDCPVEGTEPLLAAAREAMLNAARHADTPSVSVYLEVEPGAATVFVRDRGHGFDVDAVPADRGGITNSIVGRMARAGGKASVRSNGGGTEVQLTLPRTAVEEKPVEEKPVEEKPVEERS